MKRRLPIVLALLFLVGGGAFYYLFVPSQARIDFHAPKQCEYDRLQAIAATGEFDDDLAEQLQMVTFSLTEGVRYERASRAVARALRDLDCDEVESYEVWEARIRDGVEAEAAAREAAAE